MAKFRPIWSPWSSLIILVILPIRCNSWWSSRRWLPKWGEGSDYTVGSMAQWACLPTLPWPHPTNKIISICGTRNRFVPSPAQNHTYWHVCNSSILHLNIWTTVYFNDLLTQASNPAMSASCMESLLKEKITTIDFLVLTSWDQLMFLLIFFLFYKTSYFNKEVSCTGSSPSVRVPCFVYCKVLELWCSCPKRYFLQRWINSKTCTCSSD